MAYKYKVNAMSYIGEAHHQPDNCFFVDGVTPLTDGVCNEADITTKCKGKKHLFSVFAGKAGIEQVCRRLNDALMKKTNKKIRSKVQFELKSIMEEVSGTICKGDSDSAMSMIYIEGNNVYSSGYGDINVYKYSKRDDCSQKIEFPLYSHMTREVDSDVSVKLRQPARSKCIGKVGSGDEFLLVDSNLVNILGDEQINEILKEYGPNAPAKLIESASLIISAYNLSAVHISVRKSISPLYFVIPALVIAALGTIIAFPHILTAFKNSTEADLPGKVISEPDAGSNSIESSTPNELIAVQSSAVPESVNILMPLSAQLDTISAEVTGQKSKVSYFIKDLCTGDFIERNNSAMSSASLIKLYIMAEIYRQASVNELVIDNTIKDLMHRMITISDNNASNELARIAGGNNMELGFQKITENAKNLGCVDTQLANAINVQRTTPVVKSNATSVRDCALLLEKIYNGTLINEQYSAEMLDLLKQQTRQAKIPKYIPDDVVVANKTGETSIAQNDAAIVFANDKPYIICIMISKYENTAEEAMDIVARMSKAAYEFIMQAS